jgi:hypothetical protein
MATSNLGLNSGWNLGFDGAYPFNKSVAVGLDIRYSMFNYDASYFDGSYKILSIKPSMFFGSFDPNNKYIAAGYIGGGYSLLITPPYTSTGSTGYTYRSTSRSDIGLGIGGGFLYGFRLSDVFGICGSVSYDHIILVGNGEGGGSYITVGLGILVSTEEF